MPTDRGAAIALIHGLQVDLSLLAAMLAREPDTHWHYAGIGNLAWLRKSLQTYIPDVRRQ